MSRFTGLMTTTRAAVATFTLLFSTAISSFFYFEERYARADELVKLERRIEVNELKDLYKDALANLYFYRDQKRKHPDDVKIQERLDEAKAEVDQLKALLLDAKKVK